MWVSRCDIFTLWGRTGVSSDRAGGTIGLGTAPSIGALVDLTLTVDEFGAIQRVEAGAPAELARTASAQLGRHLADLFEDRDAEVMIALVEANFVGCGELTLTSVHGHKVMLAVRPLDAGWTVAIRDVSDRWMVERATMERMRSRALTGLAGALARELNDPMSVVQARLELMLQLGVTDPESLTANVTVALEHARRVSATLKNLRLVGRSPIPDFTRVLLADIVEDARRQVGPRLRGVPLTLDLQPADLAVGGDAGLYARAVANLLGHLLDHLPRRAGVTVRARRRRGEVVFDLFGGRTSVAELERRPAEVTPGGWEAGIGLSIAQELLAGLGGGLEVRRAPRAMMFSVHAPGAPVRRRAADAGTLLLAVGPESFASSVSSMLMGAGFVVEHVDDGERALARLEDGGPAPAALLTRLLLPGMSGIVLAERVDKRCPVVLVAGEGGGSVRLSGVRMVEEPLRRSSLLDALADTE